MRQRKLVMNNSNVTLTLIGSGEFGEAMGRVYRTILARAPAEPQTVFLDTPAGFEVNADAISAKAADYFSQRLNLVLEIASYKNKTRATARELESALRVLRRADFIFAGPGSPSYAIRNWRDTNIWATIVSRFERGAHLAFASAAAIAVSAFALPVYEIYKAGEELHWLEGLNLFAAFGMNLAIVPHWNNSEGGTFDTRYCFMGETRLRELETKLPKETVILGIDEYTACLFDFAAQEARVMGPGNVTIRRDGDEWVFAPEESFAFERLRARARVQATEPAPSQTETTAATDETTRYLMQLARALDETHDADTKRELIDQAHDTMHELSAEWIESAHTEQHGNIAPYIETLIDIRNQLRASQQFALADEIRERLAELGILLQDDSSGTLWRKMQP